MKFAQSCPTLCDPMDCAVHRILQARILEWVAFPFSRGSSQSRVWTQVSCIAGGFLTSWATREAPTSGKVEVKVAQSCLTLCNPVDYTVHRILQARILEWVAFAFSRGSSQPRDQTLVSHIAGGSYIYMYIWLFNWKKKCQTHCQKSCIILHSYHKAVKFRADPCDLNTW